MGFTYTEGLWTCVIRMLNILISGMLAIGLGMWVFGMIVEQWSGFKLIGPFVSMWLVFDLCYVILFTIGKSISKVKVRFLGAVDKWGAIVVATINGFLFLGFTLLTMHVAPLSQDFLWGGFKSEGQVLDTAWGKLGEHVAKTVYKSDDPFVWLEWTSFGRTVRAATQKSIEGDGGLFD